MKFKVTQKELRESREMCISVGYCELQDLLAYHSPVAYNAGVYGWNFDVYDVYGVYICTGYRGMVGKRAVGIRQCEQTARRIRSDSSLTYEQKKQRVEETLKTFIKAQYEVA